MLTEDNVKAYDSAIAIISDELARTTGMTTSASRRAARNLLTRFAAEGISLTGIKEDAL